MKSRKMLVLSEPSLSTQENTNVCTNMYFDLHVTNYSPLLHHKTFHN